MLIYIPIGIVQQIHTEKDPFSCLRDYCNIFKGQPCPHKENIQLIEFTHQVGYVTYLCMYVYFCRQSQRFKDFKYMCVSMLYLYTCMYVCMYVCM